MVFWTFIYNLFNFNLSWIVDFILNNLFWLFAFIAAGYYLNPARGPFKSLVMFSLLIMISVEFTDYFNLLIYVGIGLMLMYITRMAILLALENTQGGSRYIPLAWVLSFFFVLFIYNIFLR